MNAQNKRDAELLAKLDEIKDANPNKCASCNCGKQIDELLEAHFTKEEYYAVLAGLVACDKSRYDSKKLDWDYTNPFSNHRCFGWDLLIPAVVSVCALRQHVAEWVW